MPLPLILSTALLAAFAVSCATTPKKADEKPQTLRLWPDIPPGAQGMEAQDIPTLTVYAPPAAKRTGAAVVVCPGGGYAVLAPHEDVPIAKWLRDNGVTAFVLKYRLGPRYRHPVMMQDAARAIRTVRARAKEWSVDPHRIGILGFSAGGHLASTAATHFDSGDAAAPDPIDRVSSRPDIAVLIYPVITMTDPFTHAGSRQNLLGDDPAPELIALLSNEKQVTAQTPPTFLVHSAEDVPVPCENSLLFAEALRKHKVPVEMHLYEYGPHGFGLGGRDPILGKWPEQCILWMKRRGFLSPTASAPAGAQSALP